MSEYAVEFEALASRIVRDRMTYYGYTAEQIQAAEQTTHPAAGCHYEHPYGWVCTDEDDKPRHPDRDELDRTAEFVVWMLEHPALATPTDQPEEVARTDGDAWADDGGYGDDADQPEEVRCGGEEECDV